MKKKTSSELVSSFFLGAFLSPRVHRRGELGSSVRQPFGFYVLIILFLPMEIPRSDVFGAI